MGISAQTNASALVSYMARLHNFLISDGETNCPTPSAEDPWTLAVDGAVPFSIRDGVRVPLQLMDVGNHHDDDPSRSRRLRTVSQSIFPRERLFDTVCEKGLERPLA